MSTKPAKPAAKAKRTTKKPKYDRSPAAAQERREQQGDMIIQSNQLSAAKRANRLRALIEPKTEAMVKVMIEIAEDAKVHPSIRLEAADRVLSRAYGKPKETIGIEDEGSQASGDEMTKLLNNILEKVGLTPRLESGSEGSPTSESGAR